MCDDKEALYLLLGVNHTACQSEIKRAYQQCSLRLDAKGGLKNSAIRFEKMSLAYSILSYKQTKEEYDASGKQPETNIDPSDHVSRALFEVGLRKSGNKNGDVASYGEVSLEDIFFGRSVKIKVIRVSSCFGCGGSGLGDASASHKKCQTCDGKGTKGDEEECERCNGNKMDEWTTVFCGDCNGSGIKDPSAEFITVSIPIGLDTKNPLVIDNMGDVIKGFTKRGKLMIHFREKEHPFFRRGKDPGDLIMTIKLSLTESICGFSKRRRLIDGRCYETRSAGPLTIIGGEEERLSGGGMHIVGDGLKKYGDAIIRFSIDKSLTLSEKQKVAIEKILNGM